VVRFEPLSRLPCAIPHGSSTTRTRPSCRGPGALSGKLAIWITCNGCTSDPRVWHVEIVAGVLVVLLVAVASLRRARDRKAARRATEIWVREHGASAGPQL
jgi:hypothetical protein